MRALASVGYFDAAGQARPAADPGICAICGEAIDDAPKLYRSLMLLDGERSYFFSYHRACRDDALLDKIEGDVVDALIEWEQPQ